MDTGLKGKTVLITGASRNMGLRAPILFAREGANLALCTSAKMKELNEVAEQARALGATVVAAKCDITDPAAVANFVRMARDQFGGVDVVINLAGYRADRDFLEESPEVWHRTIDVNLNGPFHICRNVIPLMMERRWGRIINISGLGPFRGVGVAKSMVKLGIVGFTRGLAREFGEYNITANCIGPGSIDRVHDAHEGKRELPGNQAIYRKGTADEAISLMLYLASEQASYITGQCYLVNGGAHFL